MKLLVATDAHIFVTPDGMHWCNSIYGYDFWKRYLDVFEDIKVVARTKKIEIIEDKMILVDGEHVEIYEVPFYQGPKELLKRYGKIQKCLKNIDKDCDAALMRLPSQTASMVCSHLRKEIPLACEIVYDITDDVKQSGWNIVLRVLNLITSYKIKYFCRKANGVSYVTEHTIQEHYPSHAALYGETKKYFETYYSTITLSDDAFAGPKDFSNKKKLKIALSSVSMNSNRKGEKIVIEVVKKVRDKGFELSAVLIGDGILRESFENYARELGVSDSIEFTGLLSTSKEVHEVLLQADLFVFPTQGEGLPRGILEAMAVGMPVLSTHVGGIPEIIEEKYLFDPVDSEGFANEICRLFNNSKELNMMSEKNFIKSLEYRNDILQNRRNCFYYKLKCLAKEEH